MNTLYRNMVVVTTAAVHMRTMPLRSATSLRVLPAGFRGSITDGPVVSADGLTWFKLNEQGWVVEAVGGETILEIAPTSDFERAVFFVLQQEGGYVNDPNDPGGETNYGISKRSYPKLNIAKLTREKAKRIYQIDYWEKSGASQLSWPLSLTHFDFAVNAGVGQALQTLSKSGNDFSAYQLLRRTFYRSLNQFSIYGDAWLNRVDAVEKYIA